ncbi:MAG TPA: glycoside hydrolase family 95 protein, partial [Tepidisphaeraceae bacterium]
EALPIGSGRMGAMVFGGIVDERIQFNEDTLWTGKPHDYVRAGAHDALPQIQQLLFDHKEKEAVDLVRGKFLSDPVRQKAYQPFGDLRFHFDGHDSATGYRRELDLESAIASVSYSVGGVKFTREVFASYPDNAIVVHISASEPGKVSFTVRMDSPHKVSQTKSISADTLAMTGQVQDPTANNELGLRFESRLRVKADGGKASAGEDGIRVENTDSATLVLVAATSYKNFQDISADPAQRCDGYQSKIADKSYQALRDAHVADFSKLFGRVKLDLGRTAKADLPTDERVRALNSDPTGALAADPALAALYFEMGRYMLIASSRPGSQPANLQGVWNELLAPPWEGKYTTNINLEMNYWPAEVTNLSECTGPLFDMIDDLRISGAKTAREQYGARGWVLHHNTDHWRGTAPINNVDGVWPTGAAWLCHHLWEHWLFTSDKDFLARRAYPAMKEASLFFLDYLVKDPKTGWLVTNPSFSPEQGGLCYGPSMDMQMIRALFDYTTEAAGILGVDSELVSQIKTTRGQLAPDQVGKNGQIQEWIDDVDVPNNNHRHMSPLWGMYPGAQFTPNDPKLYNAAKVLLKWRGDGSTGWSYAWRMPLWARAYDGDYAFRQLAIQLGKRTFPNLFDKCGPFQVDGDFGACAGVAEMLIQSHVRDPKTGEFEIQLLPALPKAWAKGSVTGLRARGGFEVDVAWENGKMIKAEITSHLGQPVRVQFGDQVRQIKTEPGKIYTIE